ncbi:hypothetical protein GCM10023334_075830 [Nonomuraea thailandensis]
MYQRPLSWCSSGAQKLAPREDVVSCQTWTLGAVFRPPRVGELRMTIVLVKLAVRGRCRDC